MVIRKVVRVIYTWKLYCVYRYTYLSRHHVSIIIDSPETHRTSHMLLRSFREALNWSLWEAGVFSLPSL